MICAIKFLQRRILQLCDRVCENSPLLQPQIYQNCDAMEPLGNRTLVFGIQKTITSNRSHSGVKKKKKSFLVELRHQRDARKAFYRIRTSASQMRRAIVLRL